MNSTRSNRILLKGGRVVDPAFGVDEMADLKIENGRITQIGRNLKADGLEVVDVEGKVVTPGFIDLHVHLRTPGQEHKETILSGSQAALRGGFTTVCTMANTDPVVDSPAVVESIYTQNAKVGLIQVLPYAAVTIGLKGKTLTEMGELQQAGAVGFSDDGEPIEHAGIMRRALEYTKMTGLPVISHCEDKNLSANGVIHEGLTSTRLGLEGIPKAAETVMIARDIILAEATGGRLHIAHVSTAQGVELIRAAKQRGVAVTAEVTPHHLVLTEEALNTYEARFKMNPPLRTQEDIKALWQALKDGTIDAVATDHAPHAAEEKELGLVRAPFGVIGLETAWAVLYTELVGHGGFDLSDLVATLTCRPAKVLGIPRGTLAIGSAADVTVLDLDAEWVVEPNSFCSKSQNSPFLGWRLKSKVVHVLVAGQWRYRDGELVDMQ